jgi:hypothetical protein
MRLLCIALALVSLPAFGCAEDPPPPPPPVEAPPPPEPPPPTPCELACQHALACGVGEFGDTTRCTFRCDRNEARDRDAFHCLDSNERCDLVRACTAVRVERVERPVAQTEYGTRVDARGLGGDVHIALEARLLNAQSGSSRYDLVLVLRGHAQLDAGIGSEDAALFDAGVFDAGVSAPDLWLRLGPFTSGGRLPLIHVRPSTDGESIVEYTSSWNGTGDTYRVRRQRDTLLVEHAFEQQGPSRAELIRSPFETRVRIELVPNATLTPQVEINP